MLHTRSLKVIGILALSLAVYGTAQPPCTMTVSPWQPLQSILENAPPGAVICLTAGVWTQGISIRDKILTLWGGRRRPDSLLKRCEHPRRRHISFRAEHRHNPWAGNL